MARGLKLAAVVKLHFALDDAPCGTVYSVILLYSPQVLMYICPSEALAMIVCLGVNFLWGLFNGYVIVYTAIPVYWKWMNRISPTTWMLYGVVIDQLGDRSDVLVSGLTVSATRSYYPAVAGCYSTSSPTLYEFTVCKSASLKLVGFGCRAGK